MNWYKKSQSSDVSMENIIWAVDDILLKEHDYTVEDLVAAEQRMGYSQQGVAKAAQTATKRPYNRKKPKDPKWNYLENNVKHLIDQAYSIKDISDQLGIPKEEVTKITRELFPKKKDQIQYLKDINEEGILGMGDELSGQMMDDINAPIVSFQKIADALGGMNVQYVMKTLTSNGVRLRDLEKERIAKTEEMIVSTVKGMEEPYTAQEIRREFEAQHNHLLSTTKLDRMMKFKNITTKQMHTDQAIIFTAFKRFLGTKGISVKDVPFIDPQRITKILDEFITLKGPDHGFSTPMDQMKLKQLFMTKIQLRDRSIEQGQNRQWLQDFPDYTNNNKLRDMLGQGTTLEELIRAFPKRNPNVLQQLFNTYQMQRAPMITDETHPSYFLENKNRFQEASDIMNWYKKANKWRDKIPGGRADKKKPSDYEKSQVEKGKRIEYEHTNDPATAREISIDHLEEHPEYYSEEKGLPAMERKLEKKKPARHGKYRGGLQRVNL